MPHNQSLLVNNSLHLVGHILDACQFSSCDLLVNYTTNYAYYHLQAFDVLKWVMN